MEQSRHICELFERGMQETLSLLTPERAFLAYRERGQTGPPFPTPYVVHGFSLANLFTTEDISMEIIRSALASGEASVLADAMNTPSLNARATVVISGLRSVLTVPLRHPNGLVLGLIYADNRQAAGAFTQAQLEAVKLLTHKIVAALAPVEKRMRSEAVPIELESGLDDIRAKALTLQREGRSKEAVDLLESWSRGRGPSIELGIAHGIRGSILEKAGKFQLALEALSASVWMLGRKAAAPDEQYSLMLNNLAGVNVSLGYHERARGLLKTSLEQWKKLDLPGGRQQAGLAATSYNLGKLYQKMGRPDEALPWMQKALDACHRAFGPEHPKTLKINEAIAQLED